MKKLTELKDILAPNMLSATASAHIKGGKNAKNQTKKLSTNLSISEFSDTSGVTVSENEG